MRAAIALVTFVLLVRGIGFTVRLVTSATLILFLAFAVLGSGPVVVKIVATGLAAGILLDATVVRALLVPATVSLFGRWNWWLPPWLGRLAPQSGAAPSPVPAVAAQAAGDAN